MNSSSNHYRACLRPALACSAVRMHAEECMCSWDTGSDNEASCTYTGCRSAETQSLVLHPGFVWAAQLPASRRKADGVCAHFPGATRASIFARLATSASLSIKFLTLRTGARSPSLRNAHEGADENIVARSRAELQEASGEKDACSSTRERTT